MVFSHTPTAQVRASQRDDDRRQCYSKDASICNGSCCANMPATAIWQAQAPAVCGA